MKGRRAPHTEGVDLGDLGGPLVPTAGLRRGPEGHIWGPGGDTTRGGGEKGTTDPNGCMKCQRTLAPRKLVEFDSILIERGKTHRMGQEVLYSADPFFYRRK